MPDDAAQDTKEAASTCEETTRSVRNWTVRKGDLFNERHVCIAWERLKEEGWLPEDIGTPRAART